MGKIDVNVMTGTKVPALRFKGYNDEWVEKKIKELGLIQTGNTPKTSDSGNYSDTGLQWVTPTDIVDGTVINKGRTLSIEGVKKARTVPAGSILVTSIASIGKNVLLDRESGFNQQINSVTPNDDSDSYFLYTQSYMWSEYMKYISNVGTMDIVNKKDFSNIVVEVPNSLPEQQQIGEVFRTIDSLIQSEQQKLEQLQSLKKSFLQKMFPKKGTTAPELRFDGFSGDWTEKTLGDVVDDGLISLGRGKVIAKTEMSKDNSGYPVYSSSSLNNGLMGYTEEYNFDKEMITWSIDGGGYLFYRPEHKFSITNVSGYLIVDDLSFDYKYLSESLELQRPRFEFDYQNKAHPSVIRTLYSVYLTTLEEQQAIGQFLKTFDELIAKQEEKVENGKLLKKSLLQKMFV